MGRIGNCFGEAKKETGKGMVRDMDEHNKFNKTFKVIDKQTNQEVMDAFVLLPTRDSAARTALAAYAELREIRITRIQEKENKNDSSHLS